MRRVLSVWLPFLSTDLVKRTLRKRETHPGFPVSGFPPLGTRGSRREPAPVILLTRAIAARELVERCCPRAARAGVRAGMDLAQARSLLPTGPALHIEEYRPEREHAALHALACWMLKFCPVAAVDGSGTLDAGLLFDISGAEHLHGGEARLIRLVAQGLRRLGFLARIAGAATFACASGVARYGQARLAMVATGHELRALRGLGVEALRIDEATLAGLVELGVRTIGHVLDLPRASLVARFPGALGPQGVLTRLDQALGAAHEAIEPVRPEPPIVVERTLEGPTDRWETLEALARVLLVELVGVLRSRGRGARELRVVVMRPRQEGETVVIRLSLASASERHLWALLRSRLEKLDLGEGFDAMRLHAARTGRLADVQQTSAALMPARDDAGEREDGGPVGEQRWGELIDTLTDRLGAADVVLMQAASTHVPERATRTAPAIGGWLEGGASRTSMDREAEMTAGVAYRADRPSIVMTRAEEIQVLAVAPDGPLARVRWRGRAWEVLACIGPERIEPEWWRARPGAVHGRDRTDSWTRDYYAAQIEDGRWIWACRVNTDPARWFVQGVWG
ncbi:MAG: DNA polymerase Y family protein [Planctomycetota bacterium]|nr:DNA polymerase Y family protein [Planctomycetota bacterium]